MCYTQTGMEHTQGEVLHDRYRIVRLLGQGGMGAVYQAHDTTLNRSVAIKQLQLDPITGELAPEQIRQQFLREAQSLAALHHPNLPRVTDYFTQDNLQYLVMDFIEGESLQDVVAAHLEGLGEDQVLDWAEQLLPALDYIHQHNLIHRDIKPSNIRLTTEGRIFLVDFGLVKAYDPANPRTITMMRGIGTPQYAPPEQYDAQGSHTDQRSDIYAIGATLYHLLTGHMPMTVTQRMADPTSFRTLRTHSAKISPEVERVILRAMELDRARRFARATDMLEAFQLARRSRSPGPSTTLRLTRAPLRTNLKRTLLTIGLMGIVAAVIIIGLVARQSTSIVQPTATAKLQPNAKLTLLSGNSTPEYVIIQNTGNAPQDLTGWYVESVMGLQTFNFPAGYLLTPDASVRIESYIGAKNDPPRTLLWSTDPIWRNDGDKAILRNSAGAAISTICYGDACP